MSGAPSLLASLVLAAGRTDVTGWRWAGLPAPWVLTLAAVLAFLAARALYRRERGGAGRVARLALAGLRTAILFLLLLVLAGPYREEVETAEERAHLVVLVDTSGSMGTTDRYPAAEAERLRAAAFPEGADDAALLATPRLDLVKRILAPEGEALLRSFDRRFVLHVFAFDADWRGLGATREDLPTAARPAEPAGDPVAALGAAIRAREPTGGSTAIGAALQGVATEFLGREDRRLAGVLLVTDGRDTREGETPVEALAALGALRRDLHVTAVALGNPSTGRNVRVERIRAKDVVLVEDDVAFETALRHQGFTGLEGVRARLAIEKIAMPDGTPVLPPRPYDPPEGARTEAGPLTLGEEDEPTPVRLSARMREAGTFRVTVRADLPADAAEEDAVRDDDQAVHELRVMDQRIKVLYVDDLPRYEYRFLSNWLTREPEPDPSRPDRRRRYEAQVLLLSADPTVDQPASPGTTPLRAFPRERREIFAYDVILFGDVDWTKLAENATESRRLLGLVRDFVEEGGGIGFVAGVDYHDPLGLRDTPLEELVPVAPRDRDENASEDVSVPFRIELTDVGRSHPIFGVVPGKDGTLAGPEEVAAIWRGESPISRDWRWWWSYRSTAGLRPGAIDLARARPEGPVERAFLDDTGRPTVVFATMGYGKGRVFFSAIDAIYHLRRGRQDRIYGPFWDQVIRSLATWRLLGGNARFKITTDKESYFAGETAAVTISALDRDFEPVADPWLDGLHVENPDGEDVLLQGDDRPANAAAEGAAPGTFRVALPLRKKGTYRLWIGESTAGRETHALASRAERRVEVVFRAAELRQTAPDHDTLRTLVQETDGRLVGGRLARLTDLADLASDLPARTAERVLGRHERTQWDRSWVLLLLVGLLGLEWWLRKRSQMI